MASGGSIRRLLLIGLGCVLLLGGITAGCVKRHTVPSGHAAAVTDSQTTERLQALDGAAAKLVGQVQQGLVPEARQTLESIARQVTEIPYAGVTTVDGMRALAEAVTDAQRVLNAVGFNPAEAEWAVNRLRLATDALSHRNQPMWLQYRTAMLKHAEAIELGARQQNKDKAEQALAAMDNLYQLLRPAIRISRPATSAEKLQSLTMFVKNRLLDQPPDFKAVINASSELRSTLDDLFASDRDTPTMVPPIDRRDPILWTLMMAGAVLAALGYAAVRMYRFEHNAVVPARKKTYGEGFEP